MKKIDEQRMQLSDMYNYYKTQSEMYVDTLEMLKDILLSDDVKQSVKNKIDEVNNQLTQTLSDMEFYLDRMNEYDEEN